MEMKVPFLAPLYFYPGSVETFCSVMSSLKKSSQKEASSLCLRNNYMRRRT